MTAMLDTLNTEGLKRFQALQSDAVSSVIDRFYTHNSKAYQQFGPDGREVCCQDLAFHLEFLRPVLEFGLLQPMVDYLHWLDSVLVARAIPTDHLALSLNWLAEFFVEHMPAADGAVVSAALLAARSEFLRGVNSSLAQPIPPEAWPEVDNFEASLLAGDQRLALEIVNRCLDNGRGLIEIEQHIIQVALYRIGEKWQANLVTVAQEHLATAIVESVMTIALLRTPPPISNGKKVLLACVEENNHAVGLRMVADAFRLGGWEVRYLGANVPSRSLVQQVSDWKPHLIGLSVSFPQQLHAVRAVITQLSELLGDARPPVVVGGLAINRFDKLAGLVGADSTSSDAPAALANADLLVPLPDRS